MLGSDREIGKAILIVTTVLFIYYTIWIFGLPFIDDYRLKSLFYSEYVALMVPAISGLCFVGGLILFTLYHIKPYVTETRRVKQE